MNADLDYLNNGVCQKYFCNRMAPVAVGDAVPSVDLFENTPGNKVS